MGNQIVICKDNYDSEQSFHNAIKDAVMLLLANDYIMTVRYDEKGLGVVVIEYDHNDDSYGGRHPFWLTANEALSVAWENSN
jgi:hypothetical protein